MCAIPFETEEGATGVKSTRVKCDLTYTQKCRFMGKEVREISHFFVALPRVFALAV